MSFFQRFFGPHVSLRSPEMRVFWFLLPIILVVFIIDIVFLPYLWSFLTGALLVLISIVAFFISAATAKLNNEIQLERNKLKGIVLGLEDGIIVYDQNLVLSFFNSAAESIFKIKASEVLGRRLTPQDIESDKTRLLAQVMFPSLAPIVVPRSKPGEYPQVTDLSFDNPILELRVTTAPIADDRGKLLGFMKIVRDRTREITLLRAKTDFITIASHQLRTPISEINWGLESLSQDAGLSDNAKELAKNILSSSRKLMKLVEDLLNITRIEEGRFGYNFQSVDIVSFLDDVLAEIMPQVTRVGLKLYFDRPKEKLPQLTIDPQKISMVISNLVDNAVRYNVQGGSITVKVAPLTDKPYIQISVKDTGIGILPEDLPKIFSKFFRSSNAVKFQTEGSGLGLYIARNIVRAHGGEMWVESELNRGSTFYFILPTDPSLVPQKEIAIE